MIENEENIDDTVLIWNKHFSDVADAHAPIKKRRISGNKISWMSSKLRETMRDQDYYHWAALKSHSNYHWKVYKKLRNFVNHEIKSAELKYYVDIVENNQGNDGAIWKALNDATGSAKKSSTYSPINSDRITCTKPNIISTVS